MYWVAFRLSVSGVYFLLSAVLFFSSGYMYADLVFVFLFLSVVFRFRLLGLLVRVSIFLYVLYGEMYKAFSVLYFCLVSRVVAFPSSCFTRDEIIPRS